jgi:hypothetical protein
VAQIHELLPRVMADIGSIGKTKRNTHQGYDFRGVDDALNVCGPILVRHGVSVSVSVRSHSVNVLDGKDGKKKYHATLLMALTFWAPDGSSIENVLAGEALDTEGDKATNKAMSAAYKYGIFLGLVVPVASKSIEDSDRGDSRNGHSASPQTAASTFGVALAAIRNAANPKALDKFAARVIEKVDAGEWLPEEGQQAEREINKRRQEIAGKVNA